MKKLSFLAILSVLCLPIVALAQEQQEAPRYEFFGGYSILRSNGDRFNPNRGDTNSFLGKITPKGLNTEFTSNFTRNIGGVVEFGRISTSTTVNDPILGPTNID